jgi:hypothetical protein
MAIKREPPPQAATAIASTADGSLCSCDEIIKNTRVCAGVSDTDKAA